MWYYTENEQPYGPFEAEDIQGRVANGTLPPSTFVWREGLPNWVPFDEVEELRSSGHATPIPVQPEPIATPQSAPIAESVYQSHNPGSNVTVVSAAHINAQLGQELSTTTSVSRVDTSSLPNYVCCECAKTFSVNMMVYLEGRWVCATCKPVYIQKLEERYYDRKGMTYAAFSTRFHSGMYDLLIMYILFAIFSSVLSSVVVVIKPFVSDERTFNVIVGLFFLLLLFFGRILYEAFSIGIKGSTPGQERWGLRVVKSNGRPISLGWAFLRSFANVINHITFGLGFAMIIFDDDKRSISDVICGTRVLYNRK